MGRTYVSCVQAAEEIHFLAGRNPAFPDLVRLICALFGSGDALRWGDESTLCGDDAALIYDGTSRRIHVRRGLSPETRMVAIGREVARWYMSERDAACSVEELTSEIVLPTAAVRTCSELGYDAEEIAAMFHLPLALVEQRLRVSVSPNESGSFPSVRVAI